MDNQALALLQLAKRRQEVNALLTCNEKTASYGLTLSGQEVLELVECRDRADFQWNPVGLPCRRVLRTGISVGLTESRSPGKPGGRCVGIFLTRVPI